MSLPTILGDNTILGGLDAQRPNPGIPGRLYLASDSGKLYFDNGTAWELTGITGGGTGSGIAPFMFVQSSAASVWVIAHDLNTYPGVTVIDSSGNSIQGSVHYDSLNQATLTFSAAFSGTAVLV
jgi:hypothetical protein